MRAEHKIMKVSIYFVFVHLQHFKQLQLCPTPVVPVEGQVAVWILPPEDPQDLWRSFFT